MLSASLNKTFPSLLNSAFAKMENTEQVIESSNKMHLNGYFKISSIIRMSYFAMDG